LLRPHTISERSWNFREALSVAFTGKRPPIGTFVVQRCAGALPGAGHAQGRYRRCYFRSTPYSSTGAPNFNEPEPDQLARRGTALPTKRPVTTSSAQSASDVWPSSALSLDGYQTAAWLWCCRSPPVCAPANALRSSRLLPDRVSRRTAIGSAKARPPHQGRAPAAPVVPFSTGRCSPHPLGLEHRLALAAPAGAPAAPTGDTEPA
jgi:hypothetical protein